MLQDLRGQKKRCGYAVALVPLLVWGCSAPPPPPPDEEGLLQRELDAQLEVLHQTREVVRYMDARDRERQDRLSNLGLDETPPHDPNPHE